MLQYIELVLVADVIFIFWQFFDEDALCFIDLLEGRRLLLLVGLDGCLLGEEGRRGVEGGGSVVAG